MRTPNKPDVRADRKWFADKREETPPGCFTARGRSVDCRGLAVGVNSALVPSGGSGGIEMESRLDAAKGIVRFCERNPRIE